MAEIEGVRGGGVRERYNRKTETESRRQRDRDREAETESQGKKNRYSR
jgi:hypothetical protein